MITVIDNYDSFTWNLVHYLAALGAKVQTYRNDLKSCIELLAEKPKAFLLSPGPGTPDEAGICLELVRCCAELHIPLLGVCLGHQAIGQAFGGRVVPAARLMHGKTSPIIHGGQGLFQGIANPFDATRYHSLIVERVSLPGCLTVTAHSIEETSNEVIMGIAHNSLPIYGVQFHPESIGTDYGHDILANFLCIVGITPSRSKRLDRPDCTQTILKND